MPVVTLYPSHKEVVNSYMASIRLASSIRNSMDAQKAGQKAGVVGERAPVNADSYARHRPNFPPDGRRNADTAYNKTSSAHSAVDTTQSGSVPSQDRYPSSSQSMSTGIWPLVEIHASAAATNLSTLAYTSIDATIESRMRHHGNRPPPDAPMGTATLEDRAAHIPTGLKPGGLGQHHESFPPPEPPIGATQVPPGEPVSRRTGPTPIDMSQGPSDPKLYVPGGLGPACQLYATNTDIHNVTFAVCPITKRTANPDYNLTSRQRYLDDVTNSQTLAIRDTAMCEEPTGFDQRLACGQFDKYFAIAFFVLLYIIVQVWILRRKSRTQQSDEENGTATWPRLSGMSPSSPDAEVEPKPRASKVSRNSSEAKLTEKVREAHEEDQGLEEELSAKEYESTAWRSVSHRAARANAEGRVEHDAGPVAVLPSYIG
ncbi:hypothetical protein IMSHALPRED_000813 [Imshaugia aleurites]|uniref:Uncharacterized protein n=1 Tax=Imshaugia aleurites TaxID=172621 RepID=A0A8H3PE70_9LECA|nr:hypothetical protein IMSHALPRED_000813 [Imshaugia aleurites]